MFTKNKAAPGLNLYNVLKIMERGIISDVIYNTFHGFNPGAIIAHVTLNIMTFFVTYLTGFVMGNIDQFAAITAVVVMDSALGIACALKRGKFETRKALKFVYYFVGYSALLSVCLLVEKAFTGAFWLSETIIIPVLTFQVISILKNMHRFGIITSAQLGRLLDKIDKYKDEGDEGN